MAGKLKKGLITFSPLAQGQLTDRYLHGIPEDSRIRTDGRFLKESTLDEHRLDQIRKLNDWQRSEVRNLLTWHSDGCFITTKLQVY